MANLIQNKTIPPSAQVRRPQGQPARRTNSSLSPETKSHLWMATMCGILGATWFAQNKQEGGSALIQLNNDQFESATKKLKNTENTELKKAFSFIKQMREGLETEPEKNVNALFGNKTELSQTELIKTLRQTFETPEKLDTFLLELNEKLIKMPIIAPNQNGITTEFLQQLQENVANKKINEDYVKAFQNAFPIGSKPTQDDCIHFLENYTEKLRSTIQKGEEIQRLIATKNSNGMVSKEAAKEAFKKLYIDNNLDNLQASFNTVKNKLPKARIKGALKFAGIAMFSSLVAQLICSIIRSKSSN